MALLFVVNTMMSSSPTKSSKNCLRRWRAVRSVTAFALIAFLVTASAVQAEPVRVNQVVQTLSSYQGPAELKLNTVTQDPASGTTKTANPNNDAPVGPGDTAKVDGVLPGLPTLQDTQQLGVEVIAEADVEGTICDCGEILIPGGGFPKWPLLFLTAVPLVFINNDCDDCDDNPISTPTPTPPPPTPTPTPPIPEPASLLLFGTGLVAVGAGLRRRHLKMKAEQVEAARKED